MPVKRKFLSCGLALLLCSVYGSLGALAGAPAPEKAAHHCTAALCASQDAQAPTSTPVPGRRLSSQPGFSGWTLLCTRLPRNFVALGQWYYADNTYAWDYQWRGELDLSLQRMKPVTMTEAGLSQALVSWGQQPSALTYQADAALTQQLGLPTYRATYFEGVGEAQRTNLDVLVQTEKWTLRFHAAAASDRWGDYAGLVEGMHLGLVAGDSDAWPQVPDPSPEEDPSPERQLENLQPYLDRLAGAALASETPGYGQGGRPDAALAWALLQDVLQDQGAAGEKDGYRRNQPRSLRLRQPPEEAEHQPGQGCGDYGQHLGQGQEVRRHAPDQRRVHGVVEQGEDLGNQQDQQPVLHRPPPPSQQKPGDKGQGRDQQDDPPGGGVSRPAGQGQPPQGLPDSGHRGGQALHRDLHRECQGQRRPQQGAAQSPGQLLLDRGIFHGEPP